MPSICKTCREPKDSHFDSPTGTQCPVAKLSDGTIVALRRIKPGGDLYDETNTLFEGRKVVWRMDKAVEGR